MSKKSASQTKVFISFGDVAGGLKSGGSGSTAMSSLSTPLPLYTGSDSELVMLSKKLMKKDGVTKLKAIQDLVVVLPTRPEHILSDFLVFFVYGFSKLWVEDHRAIREKLCAIITTIVTVEKRLLAPHMKTLIGPWWMLTGDPIGDVSHAAFSAFCSAIPPKKRQQVLVYLSGPILSEAIKNINLRSDALCDLAVTPIEEAEERLERVIVSSLASIEKFITMLTTEQNQQLASVSSGSSSPSDPSASYRDLFTASVWTKCLESKFVLVRRAAYQLMATAASHVPEVFFDQGSSQSVSSLFFQQVVNCLLVETSVLNLNVLLSSFISLLTAVPAFFSVATVSGDIIPALSHLLKTNPQLALEFVLPIVGCFPTALVALLEDQPETEQDSQAAICGFLQQLSDLAEQKGSDGIVQGVDADADALGAAAGKAKSGRRNAAVKLDLARHAQEQGQRMECIALGMQSDVCAVELATLLLLRRTLSGSSSPASAVGAAVSARVQEVVSQLVQSIIITVQSAAIILRNEIVPQNKSSFHKAMGSVVQSGAAATVSAGSAPMKESARAALSAVGRSLLQLQRATHMEMHASGEQWTRLLWEPLGDGVLDLYLVTNPPASPTAVSTGDANASASAVNDEAATVAAMRSVTSLANCIVQVLLPAWAEGAATGQAASSGAGVVGSALARLAAQQLRSASNDATRVVLLSQLLLLLVDPGVGLVDNVVAGSDTAELLSGDWLHSLIAALSGSSASSPASVSYILSAGFVDVVAFVGGQANGDSARAVLGRCVQADSVECVSIVCKCAAVSSSAFQSAWDPDGLAWVLRTGLNALQGDASVSLSDAQMLVRFMLLVCSQPACGSLATDLFVLAKSRWCVAGLRNKLAEWFMVSLVAVALKQNQSQRSAARGVLLPPDLLAAVGAWLGENPSALPSYLRRLFFARLRDRDAKRAAIHSDYTQLSILNDVTVVVSWADAQKLVLPHLTPQLRLDLYLTISSALNSSLVLADSAGDEDEVGDHGADTCLSVLPTESGLHSKKWARHVCALLSAQQSTAALESVKLFTISFWSDCLRGILNGASAADAFSNQKRLTFALECLHAILSLPMGEDGQIGSALAHFYLTSQPMLVFWILLGVTHSSRVLPASSYPLGSDSTEHFLLKLFAGVPNDLRAPFFVEMLDVALDKEKDQDQASAGHLLQDLRAAAAKTLLEREFPTKPFPRELLRLQSPSLRRDERPALGSPGQYLSWKIVAAADPLVPTSSSSISSSGVTPPTDSPQLTRISPIACKLAGVHREAGSDPYFTITMDQTGDVQVAHELQVEWPKVILGRNLPSSHVDLVWNYQPGSSVLARISRTDKFESPVLEACTQWLEKTLMSILQDLDASSNGDSTSTIIRHCTLYSDVLSALCGHLLEASNGIKSTLEGRVTAHVRGLAAFLLSPRCTLPAYTARSTGMLLLQALLRTDLGTGAGLWLPAVLNHVRVIAASLVSPISPVDEMQAANLLSFTTATLARILSVISHSSVCLDCAEALLPAALAALPSPATALAPKLLLLLAAVWRHRSDGRDGRDGKAEVPVLGDLSAWETEGFDFSVFVMVEGLAGQPARVRMDACRAVHFCLLKRSRKSCRDLMAPSLVSRFAQQLQRIAVTDPAAGSSPLSVLSADMATVNTLRMTSCKVLDAFEASKGDSSPGRGDNKTPVEPETLCAPNDVGLQEQERLELEQDGRFLSELVGSVYSAELTQRLVITAANISGEATIDGTTDENDEDGIEGPPTPSSESQTGGGRTPVRKAAKRAALHHLTVRDPLGSVLLWLLLLQSIDARAVEGWTVRARCVNYLKNTGMASNMLFLLIRLSGDMLKFRDVSALLQRVEALHGTQLEEEFSESRPRKHSEQAGQNSTGNIPVGSLQHLAVYALFRTVCTLPAMFRQFWSDDCTRVQKTRLSKFVEERVRESLMKREVALIATSSAAGRWDAGEFAVRGSVVSGEVTAVLSKEETTIEIKVKLPPSYPLKIVEVACTSRIGVSDGRWRRWVLQIIQLLGMQDGSVVDAVLMWKCNIEKELEGVEPCPICYCTLHTKTLSLPSMACPTCNNKFHSPCLSTWFKSSGKSKCVICQQPFFN